MKHKSNSQFAFSNPRFLIGLFLVLISVSLALVGSGAVSKASGNARESMRSPQTAAAIGNAQPLSKDVTIRDNPGRYLDEISVFDTEFATDGTAFLGTQDSVRESTDGGLSWVTLNLGIGANDQVFHVALDPSNSSTIWAGIADASGSQPVNIMRSTDGGATWTNRTPPLAAPISGRGIAVDPGDSNTVIAVFGGDFGGGQVWVTTDGGLM